MIFSKIASKKQRIIFILVTTFSVLAIILLIWELLHQPHKAVSPSCVDNCSGTGGGITTTTPPPSPPPTHPPPVHHATGTEWAETRGHGSHLGIEKHEIHAGTEDDLLARYIKEHPEN